jgi:hypothetical protein
LTKKYQQLLPRSDEQEQIVVSLALEAHMNAAYDEILEVVVSLDVPNT